MTEVRLLPEAEFDLAQAAIFLETRVPGLGADFTAQADSAIDRLRENPRVGTELNPGVRKLMIRRFPYNLIYRVLPDFVLVLAVAHHRRRPGYWRERTYR